MKKTQITISTEMIIKVLQGIAAADRDDFASTDEVNRVFNKYRPT